MVPNKGPAAAFSSVSTGSTSTSASSREGLSSRSRSSTPRPAAANLASADPKEKPVKAEQPVDVTPTLTPLWAVKLSQFLLFVGNVMLARYLPYYYTRTLSLSTQQIGSTNFINKVAGVSGQICWPAFASWIGKLKAVTAATCVMLGIVISLHLLPWVRSNFSIFSVVVVAHGFLYAVPTLLDGLTVQVMAEKREEKVSYGDFRFFATFGWCAGAVAAGGLVRTCGIDAIFPCYLAISASNAALIAIHFPSTKAADGASQSASSPTRTSLFSTLLANAEARVYLINLFVYGACAVLIEDFLSVYLLTDFSNTNPAIVGFMTAITGLSEMPVYRIVSPWILKKNLPLVSVMTLAQLVLAVRCLCYTALPDPWLVLPVEMLHGITFATVWCMQVEYGKRLVPVEAQPRMQMLISTLLFQASYGSGGLFWGRAINKLGFRQCFCLDALCVVMWVLVWRTVGGSVVKVGGMRALDNVKQE